MSTPPLAAPPGWPFAESPFHRGERAVQERLGVLEKMNVQARRGIRDFMPDQHRQFFAQLPLLIVGTIDEAGQPWASALTGQPGFVSSPHARQLDVQAAAGFADPLHGTLKAGASIGLLGIEPHTRRRNRMNGTVVRHDASGFSVGVSQSYGNCPQYIQARKPVFVGDEAERNAPRPVFRSDRLDDAMLALVANADTLFIATAFSGDAGDKSPAPEHGVDVSHRGGKPGFVRIDDAQTLTVPDFVGNFFFNTIGNLQVNPRAGLLFIDFTNGDLLYLAVETQIVWGGEEVEAFAGAERLFRFHIKTALRVANVLPLRWGPAELSPLLARTGSWSDAARRLQAEHAPKHGEREFVITRIEDESTLIRSFYLMPTDGQAVPAHKSGQFLPVRLDVPGQASPVVRTYTLSDAPNGHSYRISVKRETHGTASRWLHDEARVGTTIAARSPSGTFTLDLQSKRPLVLLSAGVGITPMIAMLNTVLVNDGRSRYPHPIHFIHGARNGRALAFGPHVRALAARYPSLSVHLRLSTPDESDRLGETHDSVGRIDLALLKQLLPLDDYDFYLCGPIDFLRSLGEALRSIGIRDERIKQEAFGSTAPAEPPSHAQPQEDAPLEGAVVEFVKSGKQAVWAREHRSLLDVAISAGVDPLYSCRSGICGTCATRLLDGEVTYRTPPTAERAADEVLICCAMPKRDVSSTDDEQRVRVVLDL